MSDKEEKHAAGETPEEGKSEEKVRYTMIHVLYNVICDLFGVSWGYLSHESTVILQTTPIFGSASTFGAGTGFGGFSGVTHTKPEEKKDGEDEEEGAADEEECAAEFKPVVQLDEVEVATGEEDEECLLDMYVSPLSLLLV